MVDSSTLHCCCCPWHPLTPPANVCPASRPTGSMYPLLHRDQLSYPYMLLVPGYLAMALSPDALTRVPRWQWAIGLVTQLHRALSRPALHPCCVTDASPVCLGCYRARCLAAYSSTLPMCTCHASPSLPGILIWALSWSLRTPAASLSYHGCESPPTCIPSCARVEATQGQLTRASPTQLWQCHPVAAIISQAAAWRRCGD